MNLEAGWSAIQPETDANAAINVDLLNAMLELSELGGELEASLSEFTRPSANRADDSSSPNWITDISDIRAHMADDEAIVANLISMGSFYRVCIRQDDFHFTFVEGTPELADQIVADTLILRAALTATHQPSADLDSQYPTGAAVRLHDFLFGGLEECLDGVARLTYRPLEELSDIPIQALLERQPMRVGSGYDLKNADWLLNKYSVSIIGSLREYTATARLNGPASGNLKFLGVGDPVLSGGANIGVGGELLSVLGELPETGDELAAIRQRFPDATILTREEATETRVRQEDLSSYGILSFATHGVIAGELEEITEPGLILTPPEMRGNLLASNGFLSATELSSFDLNARLVILSGCNTANIDPMLFGRQVGGLAEALSIAGVPTTIASLWSVDSAATTELMTLFLVAFSANPENAVAQSFSSAIRRFQNETPNPAFLHPRFWAAFAVFGAGNVDVGAESETPGVQARTLAIASYEWVDDLGSKITDTIQLPDGEYIFFGEGESDGVLNVSYVERLDSDYEEVWRVSARGMRGAELTAGQEIVYAASFQADVENRLAIPKVRAFNAVGTLQWEWSGEGQMPGTLLAPILQLDDQGRLMVLLSEYSPSLLQLRFNLLRFDASSTPRPSLVG